MRKHLRAADLMTFEDTVHHAKEFALSGKVSRYRHVLVDEAQDFSLEALRLIRAISMTDRCEQDPEQFGDPLCLAGDGHQRIYRVKIPVSRAGIDFRGRSRRLKVNYRTSEQIRRFAGGLLRGLSIDDLDGSETNTQGDHSVFQGPDPIREGVIDELRRRSIATHRLRPRHIDPGASEPGVRIATMPRIKGLEYRAVAMLGSGDGDPLSNPESASVRDRCTLYVAATRAREQLFVSLSSVFSDSRRFNALPS